MRELQGDIFELAKLIGADALCVTTNAVVVGSGRLVMGGGVALAFAEKFPWLPRELGRLVDNGGNQCYYLKPPSMNVAIISFPTKEHWRDPSTVDLVRRSARELMVLIEKHDLKCVLLPRPGVGLGTLDWTVVKPLIQEILDDRVVVVSK